MQKIMKVVAILIIFMVSLGSSIESGETNIAVLKYSGGGDWYANPTALTNLALFCNEKLNTNLNPDYGTVEVGNAEIYNYPFIHMTGHGNVVFSDSDAENLRNYLISGGFLHIDDNYGMDPYVRLAMKKAFPELDFIELPFEHPIYSEPFKFENGIPKIHKHDEKPSQGFGLIWEGRLICYYSYETDLGDGWEDQEVHNDTPEKRLAALQMGANIIQHAFSQ